MIAAIAMMRDEADVAGAVVAHLFAHGVDRILVNDNNSVDGTGDILRAAGATVFDDPERGYYQDRKMSALATVAYEMGADWVLPFDADEIFYPTACPEHPHGGAALDSAFCPSYSGGVCPSEISTLAEFFATCTADVIEARGWDHIATACNPGPFSPDRREAQQKLPKVAFRACVSPYVHMGNHDVDRHHGLPVRVGGLSYRHFQYRSLEQYVRKVRNGREAYEASDLHYNYGTHWRVAGAKSDAELAEDWAQMCAEPGLIFDPAPVLP